MSDRNQLCEVCLKAKAGQSCSEAVEESTKNPSNHLEVALAGS